MSSLKGICKTDRLLTMRGDTHNDLFRKFSDQGWSRTNVHTLV